MFLFMKKIELIQAIGVAGGGANLDTDSIAFHHIRASLAARAIPFVPVHGVEGDPHTSQRVRPASEQLDEIKDRIDAVDPDTKVLLITQCLGTVASLRALECYQSDRPIAMAVFSPPLPSPQDTIAQPKSRAKRSQNNTKMRTVHFEPGHVGDFDRLVESSAIIPPEYFADIHAAIDLEPRLLTAVSLGSAAVVGTSHDWNAGSPDVISEWISRDPNLPIQVLDNTGHSLNAIGSSLTREQKIREQRQACDLVIDAGISLLDS
jgi:hypothetical protein